MRSLGVLLLIVGCVTAAVGLALLVAPRIPWLGHLPGDIHCRGKNSSFHFPLTTCILVSIVLTVALNLVMRWFRR
jgi:NADH:ubiquinone oxidoreductase subunit K